MSRERDRKKLIKLLLNPKESNAKKKLAMRAFRKKYPAEYKKPKPKIENTFDGNLPMYN